MSSSIMESGGSPFVGIFKTKSIGPMEILYTLEMTSFSCVHEYVTPMRRFLASTSPAFYKKLDNIDVTLMSRCNDWRVSMRVWLTHWRSRI